MVGDNIDDDVEAIGKENVEVDEKIIRCSGIRRVSL